MVNLTRQLQKNQKEDFISSPPHYLVVDDDATIRDLFKSFFAQKAEVTTACNGREALKKMNGQYFDAIISDVDMPSLNGIDFFKSLYKMDPTIVKRFLFCTGSSSSELKDLCSEHQVRFIYKPFHLVELQSELAEINTGPAHGNVVQRKG